ncbi:hypothetical protein IFU30_12490 [Plantibacter sp. CFBP 8798]|uniref:hypothetical protein n=1 Tax=Plantibacter sp. CFBP 8798 TaxID=2775268 RepID=UPI00177F8995|nr:hypothetical protein [Plantibacter sp. CFBP 8798]MBD8467088.1 hypothetical protein [Plantibacter sp. CFBP 8798]
MTDEHQPLTKRIWRACLLLLGSVLCLWITLQVLREIWIGLAILIGIVAATTALLWLLRARQNRW